MMKPTRADNDDEDVRKSRVCWESSDRCTSRGLVGDNCSSVAAVTGVDGVVGDDCV